MEQQQSKTISPEDAVKILEETWAYYSPEPLVTARDEAEEAVYVPYAQAA